MLTNRIQPRRTRGGADTASMWSCVSTASGAVADVRSGLCPSALETYRLEGQPGRHDAKSIRNPRLADGRNQN